MVLCSLLFSLKQPKVLLLTMCSFTVVESQCWGSVTFSGSADSYLWPMNPDPTPDPTTFFSDFKDEKKFSLHFFLLTYPQYIIFSLKNSNFLLKFCVKILFCQALFQSAQDIYGKREESGSVPLTNGSGSGSGRPKNMRILRIRIRFRILNTGRDSDYFS